MSERERIAEALFSCEHPELDWGAELARANLSFTLPADFKATRYSLAPRYLRLADVALGVHCEQDQDGEGP